MLCRRENANTDGPRLGLRRNSADTVLSIGSCEHNGRLSSIGGRGYAGDARIPSFLARPGNWAMMIMTVLCIGGLSIVRVIKAVPATRLMRFAGTKTQRRVLAHNGDCVMTKQRTNNVMKQCTFFLTPFALTRSPLFFSLSAVWRSAAGRAL